MTCLGHSRCRRGIARIAIHNPPVPSFRVAALNAAAESSYSLASNQLVSLLKRMCAVMLEVDL